MLGRHPVALRRELPEGYRGKPRSKIPYGLTEETDKIRARLGSIIAAMSDDGLSREQIGEITGLNARQSFRAERRPFSHDWTLSQMERTLAYDTTRNPRIQILEADAEDEGCSVPSI